MEKSKGSITLTIAWIILLLVGLLMAVGGLGSLQVAYFGAGLGIQGVNIEDLAKIHPDLPDSLRGRRATAATLAVTCGILVAWIAVTAYRRGHRWAWWALLCSIGLGSVLSILRLSMLSRASGAGTAGFFLGLVLLALAISYRDFK